MRKSIMLLFLLAAVILSGCLAQGQTTSPSSTNSQPAPTIVLKVPAQTSLAPVSGCTVVSQKPTPGPTQPPTYPLVSESDWVKGLANAKVTIIEYSDFQ